MNKLAKPAWILILALLFCMFPCIKVSAETTTLSVQPTSSRICGVGEEFEVDITVTDVNDLYGWEIKLYYDSRLLNGTMVNEGPFLKEKGNTYFMSTLNDSYSETQGRITAACTLIGNISGVTGSGVLATIGFKTKDIGNCLLLLSETKLGTPNSTLIPHNVAIGAVQVVTPIHDISIYSISLSKPQVVEGQIVDIHVQVANEGDKNESFTVNLYANNTLINTMNVVNLTSSATKTLIFSWNTSGAVINSTYQISAEAVPVPDEADLSDNILVDGVVQIIQGKHDVAVTRITPQYTTVYKGKKVDITVGVTNKGDYYETFTVTLYYGNTSIETKIVENLQYGQGKSITFTWDTTDVESNKTYILKAVASQVQNEVNVNDNTLVDGNITVLPPGYLSISIVEIIPCNQNGQPVSSFTEGTMVYLRIKVSSNSMNSEPLLLTINIFDAGRNTIGVISFKGPIAPGETTFMLGSPIPLNVRSGLATVYVNALTDWPHLGGVPYCPEKEANFQIISR